jgi:hypothetical protein
MIGPRRGAKPIVSFIKLNVYRRQNPDFDRFVLSATAKNNSRGQLQRWRPQQARMEAIRSENNDYHKIRAIVPHHLPDDIRDEITHAVFLSLYEGALQRDQVSKRLREFVAAHNREANKYGTGKFGLISIDAPAYTEGSTALVETISRGLWD